MTTLKGIKGFRVKTLSTDTASDQFGGGSWASDAPAPQTTQAGGSFGTSTAAVSTGGYDGTSYVQTTIEYNGSSWSSGGSMNRPAGQSFPGFGTEPSGGIAGGYKTSGNAVVNNFESYNGTAFTESTDLNSARQSAGATGASNTAGIVVGGTTGVLSPPDVTGNNNVEIWNGSSWTEISEINTARYNLKALGSTCPAPTAVVAGGENSGTKTGVTEKYNGSSWTETGDMNTARSAHGGAGNVATSGICFGGEGPAGGGYTNYANTEHFDGSAWTEVSDLVGTRHSFSTATGTGASAIAGQGRNPGFTGLTEIWTAPATFSQINRGQVYFNSTSNAFKVTQEPIPGGSWSSGGNVNTARTNCQGAGASHSSAIIWSGEGPSVAVRSYTESYDGTSWTEVNDLNSGRVYSFGDGSQTSAFAAGGHNPSNPGTYRTETETWDGTSWTVLGPANLNTGRGQGGSNGVTTSGLAYTGESPGPPYSFYNVAEELDGSTWTNISNLNRGPNNQSCRFTSVHLGRTAPASRVAGGGYNAPNSGVDLNEEWNGTSWAEEAELNTARGALVGGSGTVDNCIIFGGGSAWNAPKSNTEFWNGTTWTEISDLAAGRAFAGNAGHTATNAMAATGYNYPSAVSTTEEWTVDVANQTITLG